jgi:hypothetical protein
MENQSSKAGWIVHTTKNDRDYRCKAYKNPDRFKCGQCGRGVVVIFPRGTVQTRPCLVCKAEIKIEYRAEWFDPKKK